MARVNLVIDQGRTFSTLVLLNDQNGYPLNVVSYSAAGSMRKHVGALVTSPFTCSMTNGQLTISMTANQTSQLNDGRYVYDIALTDPSNTVSTIMEGLVTVKPMSGYDSYISNTSYIPPTANNPF